MIGEHVVGIYAIENLSNGKKYIGQSTDVSRRITHHKYMLKSGRHKNKTMQRDYDECGGNFSFGVLERCAEGDLDTLEKEYIAREKSNDPEFGYNTEAGGYHDREMCEQTRKKLSDRFSNGRANFLGRKHTPESLKKMSEAHKGHRPTEEARRKMSEAQKGKVISQHTRELLSAAKSGPKHHYYGKHLSDEHRAKISVGTSGKNNPMYGRKQSEHARELISAKISRPVLCVETGTIYKNAVEAAAITNGSRSGINNVCRNKLQTSGGYHWRYADETDTQGAVGSIFDAAVAQ